MLCVENRRELLDEMTRMLAAEGYDVVGASSGDRALLLVHSSPVDGILIDLFLRDFAPTSLRDAIRRKLPAVPILLFHGEGALLTLQIQVLTAWIRRAQREALRAGQDPFKAALEEYTAGPGGCAGPAPR